MIKIFSCHNFRNINADDLEFEKLNILIGPNNSGKSNFIKALTFFSDMLMRADEGTLKSAFLNSVARNGWEHIKNNEADDSESVDMAWEIELDHKRYRYSFAFDVGKEIENCNIVLEELDSSEEVERYSEPFNYFRCHDSVIGKGNFSSAINKGEKNTRLKFDVEPKETIIKQFRDILLENKRIYVKDLVRVNVAQILYSLQKYFESFHVYTSAQFDTKKMRQPVNSRNMDRVLNQSASNFANIFNTFKSEDILWKNQFEEKMKQLVPELTVADTVNIYDKLVFKMVCDGKTYDLTDVSEGTVKGLIMNLLINMPMDVKCPLLAIDEPENNLHPAWQKVIGNWIQTSDTYDQCFISTHSPDFLDTFTDEFKNGKVAVLVFGTGQCIKKIKYEDIADELGDWELGDLYRTNDPALGGWPCADGLQVRH